MPSLRPKTPWLALWNIILIVLFLLAAPACQLAERNDPSQGGAKLPQVPLPIATWTPQVPKDWVTVYFSDPTNPSSKSLRGGPDKALAEAIDAARVSVDVAVLQLNLWSIRDALLNAQQARRERAPGD